MKQFLIVSVWLFSLAAFPGKAQEKSWSSSVELEHQASRPEILGKGQAGYYAATIQKRRKTYLSIYHYDHSLKFKEERHMELPPKAELLGVDLVMNRVLVTYLEQGKKESTLIATVFDQALEPVKMHVELKGLDFKQTVSYTKAGDSSIHLALQSSQSTGVYFEITPEPGISAENQWSLTQAIKDVEMTGIAVSKQFIALMLKSSKKGMYCLTSNVRDGNFTLHRLSEDGRFVAGAMLEVDQLQGAFVVNGLYKSSRNANAFRGISFHVFEQDRLEKKRYQTFPEDYIQKFYGKNTERSALNNQVIRDLIPRSDGGTVLLTEEVDSETRIYRDFDYYGFHRSTMRETYYYENIGILAISNEGTVEWNKVHRKQQITASPHPLFASYSSHVTKKEIIFLYNRSSGNDYDLLSYAIRPSGDITGDLLLKASENNATPIARKARQVAHNEVIVPAFIDREKLLLLKLNYE